MPPPPGIPEPDDSTQLRLFLRAGCPFCTKLVVFLGEAGLSRKVKPILDCPPVREYVQVCCGKVSFPALELAHDQIMLETEDIIQKLGNENGINPEELWGFTYFQNGMLPSYKALFGLTVKTLGGYAQTQQWFKDNAGTTSIPCPPEGAAALDAMAPPLTGGEPPLSTSMQIGLRGEMDTKPAAQWSVADTLCGWKNDFKTCAVTSVAICLPLAHLYERLFKQRGSCLWVRKIRLSCPHDVTQLLFERHSCVLRRCFCCCCSWSCLRRRGST